MKDPRVRLLHIRDAIASIRSYTNGLDFSGYETRPMVRDAVERNIERLSEAARHLPDDWTNPYPGIPWRAVRDIGNAIRHGYDGIDDRAIWKTVVDDLPALGTAIEEMIRQKAPP